MWLKLVKAHPPFLAAVRVRPDLLDRLWYDDDPADEAGPDDVRLPAASDGRALLAAVDPANDLLEKRLGLGGSGDVDDIVLAEFWTPDQTWLAPAVGIGADRLPHEFTYGPAWFHHPPEVARIADGLSAEIASAALNPGADDPEWSYVEIARSLATFYGTAATERKAIIGGLA